MIEVLKLIEIIKRVIFTGLPHPCSLQWHLHHTGIFGMLRVQKLCCNASLIFATTQQILTKADENGTIARL
jgi:hypothetical protein